MSDISHQATNIIIFILFSSLLILKALLNIRKAQRELNKTELSRWFYLYTIIVLIGNCAVVLAAVGLIVFILFKML